MDTPAAPLCPKKIRFARWDDLPGIKALLEQEFGDDPVELREWMNSIENNFSMVLICLEGEELVGFGGLQFLEESVCILHSDLIAAHKRRQGLGSLLVFARLAMIDPEMAPLDVGVVTLPPTRDFYTRLGFQSDGEDAHDPILNQPVCRLHRCFSPEDIKKIDEALNSRPDVILAFDENPEECWGEEEE